MSQFKVGDRVKIIKECMGNKLGEKIFLKKDIDGDLIARECSCESYWELISKNKKNMGKIPKAKWKVGDVVMNESTDQKSKVLLVEFDPENDTTVYVLKCLNDSGSIHLENECDISEIEYKKMTVAELVKDYEEETGNCVQLVK